MKKIQFSQSHLLCIVTTEYDKLMQLQYQRNFFSYYSMQRDFWFSEENEQRAGISSDVEHRLNSWVRPSKKLVNF